MKTINRIYILLLIIIVSFSCKTEIKQKINVDETKNVISDNIINVQAIDFTFIVKDTIPSGWSTFKMENTGMMDHFFLLTKMPDSIILDDYINGVGGAFGIAWEALKEGKPKSEAFGLLGANLPAWYANAKAMGGTGIISPGQTAFNTFKLESGYYVMECYIKTENGQFHTELGMIRPLIVSDEISSTTLPISTVEINLSNETIEIIGEIKNGENIFSVNYKDHPEYGLGNDIHIIKTDENTDIENTIEWMDWSNIKGLVSPAPAIFIGGTQEMPVGYTSYFKCNLEPGEYAFIAETPVGRIQKFTVK